MKRILSLALLITMTISLCACNDERVVYPVEVVKPEKALEEDTETKDSEAAEEKTEEKADDESDVDVPSEEFVLLEDDEEEEVQPPNVAPINPGSSNSGNQNGSNDNQSQDSNTGVNDNQPGQGNGEQDIETDSGGTIEPPQTEVPQSQEN